MVKPRNEWNQTTKTKQNEWRKKNRSVLGADLPKLEADSFRDICKRNNISVSAALSQYVRAALEAGNLDIIRRDIPGRENADQENETPGTVDLPTANDTPGSVCRRPVSDTPGTVD